MLQDPIAAKGKAVVLNPIKIPDFSTALNSAQHTNDMQLQLYKIAAEQRQKEAALAAARAKAEQEAKDAAEKAKAKDQAEMMGLFKTKEGSYLVGDAIDLARQKVSEINQKYAQLAAKGHSLYDLSPEMSDWHNMVRGYHNWYNQNAEIAKTFNELQKKYNENPLGYESLDMVSTIGTYNQSLKAGKPYYPAGLSPVISPMKDADFYKSTDEYLTFDEQEILNSKGIKSIAGDVYIPKTTKSVARDLIPLVSNIDYFQDNANLTPDERGYKKRLEREAKTLGAFNEETGKIDAELFAKKYAEKRRPATKTEYLHQNIEKAKNDSEGGNNFEWNGGMLVMGRKGKTASLAPANTQIDAGAQFTSGWNGFTPPSVDFSHFPVVGTLSVPNENVIALNQLPENVAFEFSGGVAKPIKSKSFGNGGVKQDQLLVLPSLNDIPLNKTQLEEAKRKGLPVVYKSYKKTLAELKDENEDKVEKEVLLDVSAISKADFNNMKIASEYDQQTIDELHQRNRTKTPAQQIQTPVVQSQEKKTESKTSTTELGVKKEWKPKY